MFRIVGDKVNPEEITKATGITPVRAFSKGEEYKNKKGEVHNKPIGHWSISSEFKMRSTSVEKHAKYILGLLEPKSKKILPYVENDNFRTSIVFWWEAKSGHGGYTVSSDTFARLCRLCNDFDYQFIGGPE